MAGLQTSSWDAFAGKMATHSTGSHEKSVNGAHVFCYQNYPTFLPKVRLRHKEFLRACVVDKYFVIACNNNDSKLTGQLFAATNYLLDA